MDITSIPGTIARLRKQRGWTQAQLAAKLSVTDKAVSKWETGYGLPDIGILPNLAKVFGISVDELLGATPSPTPETKPAPSPPPPSPPSIFAEVLPKANPEAVRFLRPYQVTHNRFTLPLLLLYAVLFVAVFFLPAPGFTGYRFGLCSILPVFRPAGNFPPSPDRLSFLQGVIPLFDAISAAVVMVCSLILFVLSVRGENGFSPRLPRLILFAMLANVAFTLIFGSLYNALADIADFRFRWSYLIPLIAAFAQFAISHAVVNIRKPRYSLKRLPVLMGCVLLAMVTLGFAVPPNVAPARLRFYASSVNELSLAWEYDAGAPSPRLLPSYMAALSNRPLRKEIAGSVWNTSAGGGRIGELEIRHIRSFKHKGRTVNILEIAGVLDAGLSYSSVVLRVESEGAALEYRIVATEAMKPEYYAFDAAAACVAPPVVTQGGEIALELSLPNPTGVAIRPAAKPAFFLERLTLSSGKEIAAGDSAQAEAVYRFYYAGFPKQLLATAAGEDEKLFLWRIGLDTLPLYEAYLKRIL